MLTAKNSRQRIEACSPVVAASVGRAAEVIGTSWFRDTVRCNGFGNRGSALASPLRSDAQYKIRQGWTKLAEWTRDDAAGSACGLAKQSNPVRTFAAAVVRFSRNNPTSVP
jgi:hypothetical protein